MPLNPLSDFPLLNGNFQVMKRKRAARLKAARTN
jgi:hypothetical protein